MNSRRAIPWFLSAALVAAAPLARADKENTAELNANLQKAAAASSPNTQGLKPWHMKIAAQLFDWKGNPTGAGTIEEWWMGPGNEKRVFAFPTYQGTEIRTPDGIWRSSGLGSAPMLIDMIVTQIVDPTAAQEKMTGSKPTARTLQLGGVTLPCIMLARPNNRVADPPIGLYPSWCTEPGKDTIRVFVDDGGITIVRNAVSSFQGKDVPMELSITLNGTVLASAQVSDVSLDGMPTAPFTASSDMVKVNSTFTVLKGKKLENQASHRDEPDFTQVHSQPNPMTRATNGLPQGDIEVRLWVGEDGQIRDMLLQSYPQADAAQVTLDAVRHWVFNPYKVGGQAVPVTGTLDFEINSTDYDRQMRTSGSLP